MAFREKLSWISALATALVYGWYFWTVLGLLRTGRAGGFHFGIFLYLTIFAVVAVQILLVGVVGILAPRDFNTPEDERERLIALKGTRAAYYVLVTGTLSLSVAGIFFHAGSLLLDNAALLAVVTSSLVKDGTQIVHYRLGA